MKKQRQKQVKSQKKLSRSAGKKISTPPERPDYLEDFILNATMSNKHLAQLPVLSDNLTKPIYRRRFKKMRDHVSCGPYNVKAIIKGMQMWPPQFIKAYVNLTGPGQFKHIVTPPHVYEVLNELYNTTWEGTEKYRLLRHVDDIS